MVQKTLLKKVGYEDAVDMFKSWLLGVPVDEYDLIDWVCESFSGIDADSFQDQYDYENEAYLEAQDQKLDQALGK